MADVADKMDLASYEVAVDGTVLPDTYPILSITVSLEINKLPTAKILYKDGDVSENDFPLSTSDLAIPGKSIEISMGYHSENELVFQGTIVKQRLRVKQAGSSVLVLEAKSNAYPMTLQKKSRTFEESTDSEAFQTILQDYEVDSSTEDTSGSHELLTQHHVTDWDFILSRGEIHGMCIIPDPSGIHIKKPDPASASVHTLIYGTDILDMDLEMDSRTQVTSAKAISWDKEEQGLLEVEGSDPSGFSQGNLSRTDLADYADSQGQASPLLINQGYALEEELQAWADTTLLRSELSRIRGRVSCTGNYNIVPGDVIEIEGVNERYNGETFVSGVRHELVEGGWKTDLQVGLPADLFLTEQNAFPTHATIPGIQNLYIGTVLSLEDPEKDDRIQVHIPGLHTEGEGLWTRRVCLDAGSERGMIFRPELEDEVVVGFVAGDPRSGLFLGMMHTKDRTAPIEASDDNHLKGYISRSGVQWTIDDEKSIVTTETPGGHKWVLDDDAGEILVEDSNGNKLQMSSDGIVLESAGDLEIKASGDIKLEGTNIENKANSEFKAEGNSGATVKSSGQTVVKGSVVMLN